MWWKNKPVYVEWDLVGNRTNGFGGVVFLSAAPMVIVHEIDSIFPTAAGVALAVEQWVALVPDRYRLNEDLERFKSIVREVDNNDS